MQNFLAPTLWSFQNISVESILQKIRGVGLRSKELDWYEVEYLLDLKSELGPQQFSAATLPISAAIEAELATGRLIPTLFYTFFVYALTEGKDENILNSYLVLKFGNKKYNSALEFHLRALNFWTGGVGEAPRRLGHHFKSLNPIGHTKLFKSLALLTKENPTFMGKLLEDSNFREVVHSKIRDWKKKYKAAIQEFPNSRATGRDRNGLRALEQLVENLKELDPKFFDPSSEELTWEQKLTGYTGPQESNPTKLEAQSQKIPGAKSLDTPPAKPTALEKYLEIYNIVHFELPFMESDDRYMAELEAAEKAALAETLGINNPLTQAVVQRLGTEGISACMAELRKTIKNKQTLKISNRP